MNNLPEGWNQNKIDEREEWQRRHMKEELKRAITHFNSWLDSIKRYADCPHDKATVMHGHVLISLAKTFLSVSVEIGKDELIKSVYSSILAHDSALDSAEEIVEQCTKVATRLVSDLYVENSKLFEQLSNNIAEIESLKKELQKLKGE